MENVYKDINQNYKKLSENEQEVIDFILKFDRIEKLKLKDIKESLFISNATIIRTCKKLGYNTFNELKYAFIQSKKEKMEEEAGFSDFSLLVEVIKKDILTTLELVDEQTVNIICESILNARRIFSVGTGSSSQVAAEFNRKLKLIDLWSNDYQDQFSIERIPQIVTKDDVVVVFSLSGEVTDTNETLIKAKQQGAKVIAVTNMGENTLKTLSDIPLQVYNSPSNRKKIRSRLLLYVASTLIYERLLIKMSN